MINLILNELKKLFHRPFVLVPFLLCLGCFVLFFFHCQNSYRVSPVASTSAETVTNIMHQLTNTENPNTHYQLNKYEYILEQNLSIPIRGWQMTALNEAFGYYQRKIDEGDGTPHEIASYYRYFKLFCQAACANAPNTYLQLLSERVQTDTTLTTTEKYYYNQYYSYLMTQNIEPDAGDWRQTAAKDLLDSSLSLARLEQESSNTDNSYDDSWQEAYNQQAVAAYRLEQNVSLLVTDTDFGGSLLWRSLFESRGLLFLLQIPLVILLSGIIAGETRYKHLHLLFSQPVSRQHYFGAKFCVAMIVCTTWILLIYIWNILMASLLFGIEDLQASTLFVRDGMVNSYSTLFLLLKQYLLICLPLYVTTAFCLLVSALAPRGIWIILTTFGYTLLSWWIGKHFAAPQLTWTAFSAIGSLDMLSIIKGSAASGQTLPLALTILLSHFTIFAAGADIAFCKKQL